jgi:hypothetical protein
VACMVIDFEGKLDVQVYWDGADCLLELMRLFGCRC